MSGLPDRVPQWCRGEDWCSVTATASLINRKWKPVIIDRLLRDESYGFSELRDAIEDISDKALSNNLKELEDDELVERTVVSERPYRVSYSLTDRGEDLESIIGAMRDWGDRYFDESSDGWGYGADRTGASSESRKPTHD